MHKGGRVHRFIGKIYLYSWIVILLTGAYIGDMVIVAIVGLGFYLCLTGIRLAVLRGKPFEAIDKAIAIIGLIVVVLLFIAGVLLAFKKYIIYAVLSGVFSLIYAWVIGNDALQIFYGKRLFFKSNYGQMNWYMGHMTKMGAFYITAVGAFTAVQNVFGNTLINFLLPTVIGIAALNISRKYFINKLKLLPLAQDGTDT
jgi:hypothetical protein